MLDGKYEVMQKSADARMMRLAMDKALATYELVLKDLLAVEA